MSKPMCPHCVQLVNVLTGCGGMLEAEPGHYAMALARAARGNGVTVDEACAYLREVYDAPELAPRAVRPLPPVDSTEPFVPVLHEC